MTADAKAKANDYNIDQLWQEMNNILSKVGRSVSKLSNVFPSLQDIIKKEILFSNILEKAAEQDILDKEWAEEGLTVDDAPEDEGAARKIYNR